MKVRHRHTAVRQPLLGSKECKSKRKTKRTMRSQGKLEFICRTSFQHASQRRFEAKHLNFGHARTYNTPVVSKLQHTGSDTHARPGLQNLHHLMFHSCEGIAILHQVLTVQVCTVLDLVQHLHNCLNALLCGNLIPTSEVAVDSCRQCTAIKVLEKLVVCCATESEDKCNEVVEPIWGVQVENLLHTWDDSEQKSHGE